MAALEATRLAPAGPLPPEVDRATLLGLLDASTFSYFHQVGTCRMGRVGDQTAVVDPHLRLQGVAGLRVCDASVMPTIVRGNTYLGCVMLAERLAAMMA